MIDHYMMVEFGKRYNKDIFWPCFSILCLVAILMLGIQYIINCWERRINGRIRHRKSRKS